MSDPRSKPAEFFEAFRWPVPRSFASAIAASRFELGDVLYRKIGAYDAWQGDVSDGMDAIQVLAPPRSARGARLDGEGDRRQSNWSSEVELALIDPISGRSETRTLTQGHLLMALWQGDDAWLEPECLEPAFPRSARDLHAQIEKTEAAWVAEARRRKISSGSVFTMVVDLASDASRAKAALVEDRLRAAGPLVVVDLDCAEAGVDEPEAYHPTLVLRGFLAARRDVDVVEPILRSCLYQGGTQRPDSKDTARDAEDGAEGSPTDRFSIGRHGRLITL